MNGATRMSDRIGPEAVLVGRPVTIEVLRERLRGGQEVVPRPARGRVREARRVEEVLVVVDDQARDVLRDAHELATELEGVHRGRSEVGRLHDRARREPRAERLEDAPVRERCEATVVEEDHVGRRARREVSGQSLEVVVLARDVLELDVDLRVLLLERGDHGLVGGLLCRITRGQEPDHS